MPILHAALSFEDIVSHFQWADGYRREPLITALFLCRGLDGDNFSYITDRVAPDTMSGFKDGEAFDICEIIVRLSSIIAVDDSSFRLDGYRKITPLPELLNLRDAVIIIEEAEPDRPAVRELILTDEKKSVMAYTPILRVQP
jgi:hypothetical protein